MNGADRSDGVVKIYWKMYPYRRNEMLRLHTCSTWMAGAHGLLHGCREGHKYVANVKRFNTNVCWLASASTDETSGPTHMKARHLLYVTAPLPSSIAECSGTWTFTWASMGWNCLIGFCTRSFSSGNLCFLQGSVMGLLLTPHQEGEE